MFTKEEVKAILLHVHTAWYKAAVTVDYIGDTPVVVTGQYAATCKIIRSIMLSMFGAEFMVEEVYPPIS